MSPPLARCAGLAVLLSAHAVWAQRPAPPEDPQLVPPAPAARQVASWEEAASLWSHQSTELRVAAAEVLRAAGRHRSAIAGLLPSLDGTGLASFSLLQPPPGTDPSTAALFGAAPYQTLSLVAQLSVLNARTWNAVAAAADGQRAAQLSLDDSRRLLLLNLAQSLVAAVAAENAAALLRSGLRDALERLTLAERANRAGASTELDVNRLKQDVEQVRSQVLSADEGVHRAREALGLALGLAEPVGVSPTFQLDGLAAQVSPSCRVLPELAQRADQQAAAATETVAERGVFDVQAQFIPSLAVRSTAQAFIIGGAPIPIWNLQAVLTVPLWDGGGRYGALREAEATLQQARARKVAAQRTGTVDLARARRGVDVATRARALAAAGLSHAERTEALTRKAWDAGVGTSLELVTAGTALRTQQLKLAEKDHEVLLARLVALFALADCSP